MICHIDYIYIPSAQIGTKILGFAFVNVKNYKGIMKLCNVIKNYVQQEDRNLLLKNARSDRAYKGFWKGVLSIRKKELNVERNVNTVD